MLSQSGEPLINSTSLLWLAASVTAALLLFGGMTRRRRRLTDVLRDFVNRARPSDRNGDGGNE